MQVYIQYTIGQLIVLAKKNHILIKKINRTFTMRPKLHQEECYQYSSYHSS